MRRAARQEERLGCLDDPVVHLVGAEASGGCVGDEGVEHGPVGVDPTGGGGDGDDLLEVGRDGHVERS